MNRSNAVGSQRISYYDFSLRNTIIWISMSKRKRTEKRMSMLVSKHTHERVSLCAYTLAHIFSDTLVSQTQITVRIDFHQFTQKANSLVPAIIIIFVRRHMINLMSVSGCSSVLDILCWRHKINSVDAFKSIDMPCVISSGLIYARKRENIIILITLKRVYWTFLRSSFHNKSFVNIHGIRSFFVTNSAVSIINATSLANLYLRTPNGRNSDF